MDILAELVAKSLVTTKFTANGTRYQMLETLRHYGQERIEQSGEGEELRNRHAHWAHALVEQVAPSLQGRDERSSGDLLRDEFGNLRAAVRWAITNFDADVAFGIIASLEDYMVLRLDFEVAAWAEELLSTTPWADHPRRNLALGLAAYSAWARGDYDRALELGNEALTVERRHGSVPSWAAWQSVGVAAWFRGWQDQAKQGFGEWVDRARAEGDDFNLSWALAHLAVAESFRDRLLATHTAAEALDLARRCGSPFLIALALYATSECLIDDDPTTAMRQLREGVAIGRESGNRFAYGLCLSTLASLTGRLGQPTEALSLYRQAVENWRAAGNWTNQRILLRNLAEFAARINEHALTVRLLAALDASGEMLAADIGPEGTRLREAADEARRALGEHLCEELVREGTNVHPLVLVRDTLKQLDRLIERAGATAAVAEVSVSRQAPGGLSPRERQIVALVTAGLTNRAIADQLFISERTVDTHISRIRRKLRMTTRTQLAVWGVEHRETTIAASDESSCPDG
jgi:DNA-binding CsgD family transcriptional regulator